MSLAASYAGRLGLTAWRRKSTLLGVITGIVVLILCLQYSASIRSSISAQPVANPVNNNIVEVGGPKRTLRNHDTDLKEDGDISFHSQLINKHIHLDHNNQDMGIRNNVQFVQNVLKHNRASSEIPLEREYSKPTDGSNNIANVQLLEQFSSEPNVNINNKKETVSEPTENAQPQIHYNMYNQQGLYQMGIPYVNLDSRHPYVPEHRLVHFDLKGAPPKCVLRCKELFN